MAVAATLVATPAAHADWRTTDGECALYLNNAYVQGGNVISDVSVYCGHYHPKIRVAGYMYIDSQSPSWSYQWADCDNNNYCGVSTSVPLRSGCHTYWGNGEGSYYNAYPSTWRSLPGVRSANNSVLCG